MGTIYSSRPKTLFLIENNMPCKVNWKDKELLWELSGNISTEEFHQINHDHQADPRWDSLRFLIADFRDVISIDLPEEEFQYPIFPFFYKPYIGKGSNIKQVCEKGKTSMVKFTK